MPDQTNLIKIVEAINQNRPLRVVVESRSDTKIRRSKDLFGTIQHSITNVESNDKPIYGLKIYVESAEGVWTDVMRYLLSGLLAEVKEAPKKGNTQKKAK